MHFCLRGRSKKVLAWLSLVSKGEEVIAQLTSLNISSMRPFGMPKSFKYTHPTVENAEYSCLATSLFSASLPLMKRSKDTTAISADSDMVATSLEL